MIWMTPLISDTGILFGEGYLWGQPQRPRDAFIAAADRVKANGGKVAFLIG